MRYIKAVSFLIISLIVLFLLAALFMPNKYYIERTIEIDRPVDSIFRFVADLNYYHQWDPWSSEEVVKKFNITGNGIGQKSEWEGDTLGKGNLTVEKIIKNKEIHQLLRFYKPWEREAINIMKFENKGNKTNITWIMEGSLDYPIGRFMKVKLEDQIGKDFEHGLIKLRKYCYNNIN